MRKKNKFKTYDTKELSPCPGFKPGIEKRLNDKLVEAKSGNYLFVIKKISEQFKTWVDYEYHSDVTIQIVDTNNVKRIETDLIAPGFGHHGISLNTNRKLHTNSFFTWNDFEEQLFEKALRWQECLNSEGYYIKHKK